MLRREAADLLRAASQRGGYSLIRAGSLEEAVALERDCPMPADGGGVEIGELTNQDERFDEWVSEQRRRFAAAF